MDDELWMQSIIDIKESIKDALKEEDFPPNIKLKLINMANELVYIIDKVEDVD